MNQKLSIDQFLTNIVNQMELELCNQNPFQNNIIFYFKYNDDRLFLLNKFNYNK